MKKSVHPSKSLVTVLAVMVFFLSFTVRALPAVKPFGSGSLEEILNSREGEPFMLVLWSKDCSSCLKEMHVLAEIHSKHPGLDLVMLATDGAEHAEQLHSILEKHHLGDTETWAFSEAQAPRLRYEIDPTWYGELPRTYFYEASHQRIGRSGTLDLQLVDAWVATLKQ